jgi:hypothetical protein
MDLNQCRYSLIVTLIIILLPYVKSRALIFVSFPFHTLAPAWAFLLAPASGKISLSIGMLLFLLIAPNYFTRHFADLDEMFPRIAIVYFAFVFILIINFYKIIRPYIFNYVLICIGVIFVYIQGNVINFAYFFRLADLAFQTLLIHILIARTSNGNKFIFSFSQVIILGVILTISIIYSYVLIGGNIWRFL